MTVSGTSTAAPDAHASVSVALCFRALASSALVAGLALALFCLDDVHAPVVGWISNRNTIVALALALPALLHHRRWRRTGQRWPAWIAHGCLALGLGGAQAALQTSRSPAQLRFVGRRSCS